MSLSYIRLNVTTYMYIRLFHFFCMYTYVELAHVLQLLCHFIFPAGHISDSPHITQH